MLVRTLVRTGRHRSGEAHALRMLFASGAASVRLRVVGDGLLGGPAPLRYRDYGAFEVDGVPGEGHDIPGP
jgi:hypothetical protein